MTTDAQYRAKPGITATAIKAGRKSMLRMHYEITHGKPDTPAMRWGRLVHSAILEHDTFSSNLAIWDGGAKRGKAWSEFKEQADACGAEVLAHDEVHNLVNLRMAVMSHEKAADLINQSLHEVSLEWSDTGYREAKARVDCLGPNFIADLKTTSYIEPRRFQSQCYDLGYLHQMAWYRHGAMQSGEIHGNECDAYIIALQSKDEHDVVVYGIPTDILDKAYDECREIATKYRCCESSGVFPGVADSRPVLDFELPKWAQAGGVEWEIEEAE